MVIDHLDLRLLVGRGRLGDLGLGHGWLDRLETAGGIGILDRLEHDIALEQLPDMGLQLEGGHLDAALPVAGQLGGVPPGRLLRPLLAAALDNATRLGDRALTGPAARGDADTITADVAALVAASPGAAKAYLALARLSAGRALAAGQLRTADAERLLDILGDG